MLCLKLVGEGYSKPGLRISNPDTDKSLDLIVTGYAWRMFVFRTQDLDGTVLQENIRNNGVLLDKSVYDYLGGIFLLHSSEKPRCVNIESQKCLDFQRYLYPASGEPVCAVKNPNQLAYS